MNRQHRSKRNAQAQSRLKSSHYLYLGPTPNPAALVRRVRNDAMGGYKRPGTSKIILYIIKMDGCSDGRDRGLRGCESVYPDFHSLTTNQLGEQIVRRHISMIPYSALYFPEYVLMPDALSFSSYNNIPRTENILSIYDVSSCTI